MNLLPYTYYEQENIHKHCLPSESLMNTVVVLAMLVFANPLPERCAKKNSAFSAVLSE